MLTGTDEDDLRGADAATCQVLAFHLHLVRRDDGYAAPQDDLRAEQVGGHRGYAAPGALTLKGCDGTWMGNEEGRLLPDEAQQFVEVVGGR